MTTFLAVYRGRTIGEAKLVAVSADPGLCASVADTILDQLDGGAEAPDTVTKELNDGERAALRLIRAEGTLQ